MGDDALAEFLGQYVTWALEVYLQTKQGVQAMAPFNTRSAATASRVSFGMGGPAWPPPPRQAPAAPAGVTTWQP